MTSIATKQCVQWQLNLNSVRTVEWKQQSKFLKMLIKIEHKPNNYIM